MDHVTRIEQNLSVVLAACAADGPPLLSAAMHHAVFPRGARIRPRLCLAVASACGDHDPSAVLAAATALELMHCASLVHDDLPCFDDADTRRGRASVHRAHGEPIALLAGDALIVAAFECLPRQAPASAYLAPLLLELARSVGAPHGIVAGQAQECEPQIDLETYQQAKTGALFAAATAMGAIAAGQRAEAWRQVGQLLGAAYQVADDLRDAVADAEEMGKPAGQDARLGRPSMVSGWGVSATIQRLERLVAAATAAVPQCAGADALRALIAGEAQRLRPKRLAQYAA